MLTDQPLWTAKYPRTRFTSPILGHLSDWPTSYSHVEAAIGVPLEQQAKALSNQPVSWRNDTGEVDHQGAVLILMCEVLRLREATERCGAQKAYLLRTSIPLGDDYIQAFIEAEPEPASFFQKMVGSLKSNNSKHTYRVHKLAFDYRWLDDALYFLDKEMGRDREERIVIDLDQDWSQQMGALFGSAYQARLEAEQLAHTTPQATARSTRRPGL